MATMAQILASRDASVIVGRGGSKTKISDPELSDALRRAHTLWQRMNHIESELSGAKDFIARRADALSGGGSTISFEAAGAACTVTMRHEAEIPPENVRGMRLLLGRRFKDLVRTSVRHMATGRLLSEAGDDVLGLIRLRRLSPQFRWRSARPSGRAD